MKFSVLTKPLLRLGSVFILVFSLIVAVAQEQKSKIDWVDN